jgi:hypothetical protein
LMINDPPEEPPSTKSEPPSETNSTEASNIVLQFCNYLI